MCASLHESTSWQTQQTRTTHNRATKPKARVRVRVRVGVGGLQTRQYKVIMQKNELKLLALRCAPATSHLCDVAGRFYPPD